MSHVVSVELPPSRLRSTASPCLIRALAVKAPSCPLKMLAVFLKARLDYIAQCESNSYTLGDLHELRQNTVRVLRTKLASYSLSMSEAAECLEILGTTRALSNTQRDEIAQMVSESAGGRYDWTCRKYTHIYI